MTRSGERATTDPGGGSLPILALPTAAPPLDRAALLAELAPVATTTCGGTKLVVGALSPGCQRCAEGSWSCLFVTGRCNATCFFCPTSQDEEGVPETLGLKFPRAEDWADYLERLGFTGASLSGGEPLLDLDTSLHYLRTVKARLGDRVHLWLYTNGFLATADILARLADAGLDEIRFNLAASGWDLTRLGGARAIPTVTVEVPAVPAELTRLQGLITPLAAAGVRHLNLHQLRGTDYNLPRLRQRGHDLLPGPDQLVRGSEETALALLAHAAASGVELGVHYCSFAFRSRYQTRAARRRAAALFLDGWEAVTATGHIRCLTRVGDAAELAALATRLAARDDEAGRWSLATSGERLHLHPAPRPAGGGAGPAGLVQYDRAALMPAATGRHRFRELRAGERTRLIVERGPVNRERPLTALEAAWLETLLVDPARAAVAAAGADLAARRALELLPEGLG